MDAVLDADKVAAGRAPADPAKFPYLAEYTRPVKHMERPLVGREKELRTLRAAMSRPELCNVILLAEAGAGKALADDTIIPVNDERGYVPIRDLRPGDEAFDENGKPTKVLFTFPQGELEAFAVRLADGSEIICNDEHVWPAMEARAQGRNRRYRNLTLAEMMERGLRAGKNGPYRWRIPEAAPPERPKADLPIDPYAVGALIACGCLTDPYLSISTSKEGMALRVAAALGACAVRNERNYGWRIRRTDQATGRVRTVPVRELSEALARAGIEDTLFGRRSEDRRIPPAYLRGSVSQRLALAQGLMDACGCVLDDGRGTCYCTVASRELADDAALLLASVGHRAEAMPWKGYGQAEISWKVRVRDAQARKGELFREEKMRERAEAYATPGSKRPRGEAIVRGMDKLNKKVPMTCIYVEGRSHLFQCGLSHVATHNTALVQGAMARDPDRDYLEVDLAKMIANLNDKNEMAARLKALFDEVSAYRAGTGRDVVLFVDEFHQIVQLSDAAVEALKPLLADSGTRGTRVIAATTYEEFRKWVAPNLPLVERLQRVNLAQPGRDVVTAILRGMAGRYGVDHLFPDDRLFEKIYEYANRYMPAASQPRKSILLLDAMIGWHRSEKRPMDDRLLADVIREQEGINVAFRVDAPGIKAALDKRVFAQEAATGAVAERLQICAADLNDKSKPMSSFLFCGSTGVGKGLHDMETIPVWMSDGSIGTKLNGDLEVGDYVFNRKGEPVRVAGVYHRGLQDVYRVTLGDGRSVIADGSHLWSWKYAKGHALERYVTSSTEEILSKGLYRDAKGGRKAMKFWIPMNGPAQYPERKYVCPPYAMGALLGNGCLSSHAPLQLSSADPFVPEKVAGLIGADHAKISKWSYSWSFVSEAGGAFNGGDSLVQQSSVLREVPDLIGLKSHEKYIPDIYKHGSIEQRWELIRGLFDTDGCIKQTDGGRFNVTYSTTSERLASDIREVLFSLGVGSFVRNRGDRGRSGDVHDEYQLHVKAPNDIKHMFFSLPRKREIALRAQEVKRTRNKHYDYVPIVSIEKLDHKLPTTCIMVDDDEHLYQGPNFVVSHNTEMTKQLAQLLFDDDRNLIRMDMTEFANADSLDRFRSELTNKVWARPYSIILLDEIEKACGEVTRILLQVLDDGRLIDDNNREVTFTNAYIVVTTNAGSEAFKTISQYAADDSGSGRKMMEYNKVIRRSIASNSGGGKFPPELLGRIDCIVPFQPLSEATMKKIARSKLLKLRASVQASHGVLLKINPAVVDYLVEDRLDTDADSGGARAVVSKLEAEVTMQVASYINRYPNAKSLYVDVEGEMAKDNEYKLKSEARIRVTALGKSS